jgi:hypothetical protein
MSDKTQLLKHLDDKSLESKFANVIVGTYGDYAAEGRGYEFGLSINAKNFDENKPTFIEIKGRINPETNDVSCEIGSTIQGQESASLEHTEYPSLDALAEAFVGIAKDLEFRYDLARHDISFDDHVEAIEPEAAAALRTAIEHAGAKEQPEALTADAIKAHPLTKEMESAGFETLIANNGTNVFYERRVNDIAQSLQVMADLACDAVDVRLETTRVNKTLSPLPALAGGTAPGDMGTSFHARDYSTLGDAFKAAMDESKGSAAKMDKLLVEAARFDASYPLD